MADAQIMGLCCNMMQTNVDTRCNDHPDLFDYPDNVIFFDGSARYSLIIHNGGNSYLAINYCPWCGTQLPTSDHEE